MELRVFQQTAFCTNCYVILDAGEALIVDPGEASPELFDCVNGYEVKAIVNTHGHCDHCGGNAQLVDALNAPLLLHEADLPLLRAMVEQGAMFGVPFEPSPDPDRFLSHDDTVSVGDMTLTVRHAPGHSSGHIVLVGEDFVLCGDVIFAGSIGRTDLPGGNTEQLLQSIREQLLTLPDDTRLLCGHGPETTVGTERHTNPYVKQLC